MRLISHTVLATIFLLGCQNDSQEERLEVTQNIPAAFDATYHLGADWARVQVVYKATQDNIFPTYTITTSYGTVIASTGYQDPDVEETLDPRMREGDEHIVRLTTDDAEYPLVNGLITKLIELGANPRPSGIEKARAVYGALYTAADTIGIEEMRAAFGMSAEEQAAAEAEASLPTVLPYPKHDLISDADRASLIASIFELGGETMTYPGLDKCCGSCYNCVSCTWYGGNCGDWCAAGDHCIQYHSSSGCGNWTDLGSVFCGVRCPHTSGAVFKNSYGCKATNYCTNGYGGNRKHHCVGGQSCTSSSQCCADNQTCSNGACCPSGTTGCGNTCCGAGEHCSGGKFCE